MISAGTRKAAKVVLYFLFFFLVFFLFLFALFPADKFLPALQIRLSEMTGRKVTIGEMDITFTGNLVIKSIRIFPDNKKDTARDSSEKEKTEKDKLQRSSIIFIDEITVSFSYLSLLFQNLDLDIEIEAFEGTIDIEYEGPLLIGEKSLNKDIKSKFGRKKRGEIDLQKDGENKGDEGEPADGIHLAVVIKDISLRKTRYLGEIYGLPLTGRIDCIFNIESPNLSLVDSHGKLEIQIKDFVLGSVKSKLDISGMEMSVDPFTISSVEINMPIKKGRGEVEKFLVKSKYFDAKLVGKVEFKDPFLRSRINMYIMFTFLDAYKNKSEKTKTLIENIDAFSRVMKKAHRDDGYYGFRLRGLFLSIRPRGSKTSPLLTNKRGEASSSGSMRKDLRLRRNDIREKHKDIKSENQHITDEPAKPVIAPPPVLRGNPAWDGAGSGVRSVKIPSQDPSSRFLGPSGRDAASRLAPGDKAPGDNVLKGPAVDSTHGMRKSPVPEEEDEDDDDNEDEEVNEEEGEKEKDNDNADDDNEDEESED